MTKTSHKKNRPFDFKLIGLVEPHPVLYLRQNPGMSTFELMKTKSTLWQQIAGEMGFPVQFCLNRWNNLRGHFQKELKHTNELCPKTGLIRNSTWPYLKRLKFLESAVLANKSKKNKLSKRKRRELEEMQSAWKSDDSNSTKLIEEHNSEYNIEDLTDSVQNLNVIEDPYIDEEYSIIEEIAEEIVGTETVEQSENFTITHTMENYRKMQTLISSLEEEALQTIERRLMAFLCKCQLRALSDQTIDDLYV